MRCVGFALAAFDREFKGALCVWYACVQMGGAFWDGARGSGG